MGFLVSINGADFSVYDQPVAPPRRYSQVSDPESTWAPKEVEHKNEEKPFNDYLTETKFQQFKETYEKITKHPKKAQVAKDFMSGEVITLKESDDTLKAKELFVRHRFRHLPITNEDKQLTGIVSDRDLICKDPGTPLKEVMTQKVYAATPDTLLFEIAHLMLNKRISALPILDGQQKLIGILTTTDILKGLVQRAPLELWV